MSTAVGYSPSVDIAPPARRWTELFHGPQSMAFVLALIPLTAIVLLILFVMYMTFVPGLPTEPGWTLANWTQAVRPYVLNTVIPNTIIVGVGTTLIALFFACPLAFLLNRTAMPGRNLFIAMIAATVIIPGFIKAMGWIMLVNERIGMINKWVAALLGIDRLHVNLDNPYGMAWIMGLMLTPTLFFLISGSMRSLDPSMEDAAGVSGANKFWVFMRVSLPLVWPGILGGAIYIFMTAISIFDVPAMLGAAGGKAPVLSSELFYAVRPTIPEAGELRYGAAGVYAALIAAPSLVALYYYHQVLAKAHNYAVITGKGYRPRDVDLGRFKWFGVGFVMTYLLLAMLLPLLVLLWISLLPLIQMPSAAAFAKISLVNYRDFWAELSGLYVIRNTIYLVLSVSVISLLFSFMISWVVVRTTLPGRQAMDTIAMIPHAFPGIAFAFALLMIGIFASRWTPWLPVAGTVGVIVFAEVLNRISYTTRITNAALLQVAPELEHCARVCGAGNIPTMARVVAPLIGPSLLFAALWTALLTFREVSVALMLTQTNNTVMSVAVWRLWTHGHMGQAAAAAMVMTGVMGLALLMCLMVTRGQLMQHRQGSINQQR